MTAIFVDTNVFVYDFDPSEPVKQAAVRPWIEALWNAEAGRISFQVLQEFYSITTSKLSIPLEADVARAAVNRLLTWQPVEVNLATIQEAWRLQDRYGLSWWDTLIVSSARLAGCDYLLTEDLQNGQDFGGLVVVDPFKRSPADILAR